MIMMKPYWRIISTIILIVSFISCKKDDTQSTPPAAKFFIRGADLSFTPEISTYNINYTENDTVKPILQIMKDKGINTIRVRLWYAPSTVHSSLSEVLDFAKQIKQYGFKFWLDFHYSDWWADPGKQNPPAAWLSLNFDQLKDSIYAYTKNTMNALVQAGATPDYVQVGNEVNDGMLWPLGEIYKSTGTDWNSFRTLVEQATTAIKEVSPTTLVMIHYAGLSGATYFFQNLLPLTPDFDLIGLSYYPMYHGKDIDSVKIVVNDLYTQFRKPVVIAETAYPFTLNGNDNTGNLVWLESQIIPAYSATDSGQANFLAKIILNVKHSAFTDNFGVCYWAPDWVAYKGTASFDGSAGENQALFDFQNRALPGLDTLGKK